MTKYTNQFPQHFDLNGAPLAGYTIFFGVENEDTILNPKAVYTDSDFLNVGATSYTLDANGSIGLDIFLDGPYSVRIEDTFGGLWRETPSTTGLGEIGLPQSYQDLLDIDPNTVSAGRTVYMSGVGIADHFRVTTGAISDSSTGVLLSDATWNAAGKHWVRDYRGSVDAKWFVVGDGVANDTVAFQSAATASDGKTLYSDEDCLLLIDDTIDLPQNITLDLRGPIEFSGDEDYWFSSATANNAVVIVNLEIEGTVAFGSRSNLNRAVFSSSPTLVHVEYAKITGASTSIDTSDGETLLVDNIEIYNALGDDSQYGYGINSSSKRTIIKTIIAENDAETDGRHAVYINGGQWEFFALQDGRFKNYSRNPVQLTNTGTGNSCTAFVDNVVFEACNVDSLTNQSGCVNVGSGGSTAKINLVVNSIRVDDIAGPAFGSLYSGLDNITINRIEARNLRTAANAATDVCFIRSATNTHVGIIDCDALVTDWQAGLSIRDVTNADFDRVNVRGSGGSQAVRSVTSTLAIGQINAPSISNIFDSGSTFSYKDIFSQQTFTAADASPSVLGCNDFLTDAGALTISDFDDGVTGQEITVISKGAVTYDVTGTNLNGGTTDIVTADGDLTRWHCEDGTVWRLITFMNNSADNS